MKKINLFPPDSDTIEIVNPEIANARSYIILWQDKNTFDIHGQASNIEQAEFLMSSYFSVNPNGWEGTKKFVDSYLMKPNDISIRFIQEPITELEKQFSSMLGVIVKEANRINGEAKNNGAVLPVEKVSDMKWDFIRTINHWKEQAKESGITFEIEYEDKENKMVIRGSGESKLHLEVFQLKD